MPSINKNEVDSYLKELAGAPLEAEVSKGVTRADLDLALEREVHTDKDLVKLVGCRECGRPMVVTTFFAPAKALCRSCKGETTDTVASVGQPKPGETDPARAVNLADCLINPHFAFARCPAHPDDDEHEMELKSVSHANNHGPGEWVTVKGKREYRQTAKGETVMHQCLRCRATVSYSTTAQHQFLRQNEVRGDKHVNGWADINGVRDEAA